MHLSINSNPSATSASHNLSQAMDAHRRSLARLSSGNRIVNPADDAGGLAVGNKLDSKLSRLEKVHQNLKNTISFTELQESALRTVGTIITRMSELKTMSTDVTKNSADIENYNKEFVELQKQIEAMTKHKFNGVSLFSNTSKFAETDADGRSGHGVDLARNFVFDEYVAQSGAVLGQGTSAVTSGTDGSSTTYTLDQWRADYDEWINYDDSNWDNDFLTWMANPEPYGGVDRLNSINIARNNGDTSLNISGPSDITPLAGLRNLQILGLSYSAIDDHAPLAGLTNLTHLDLLDNWQLSDLTPLTGLSNLQWLDLSQTNISNLTPLANLTNLVHLNLSANSNITQSQKDMLELALPTTTIIWPSTILPDPVSQPTTTTTTGYPSLDQFTTEDFTNFTQSVASAMAEVGSHQSRLGFELRTNQISQVNNEAAVSRLMDVDIALESTKLAQTSVKVQSASSMVAKANELTDIAIRMLINR